MQFSDETLSIIKNFSQINSGLYFRKGNKLTTVSSGLSVLAKAEIQEEIPMDFAIHDIPRFLGVLSLFSEPEIDLGEKSLRIKAGNKGVTYVYADPAVIKKPPEKEITLPPKILSFELDMDTYTSSMKAANIIDATHMSIKNSDDGVLLLSLWDIKNPTGDTYDVDIGTTELVGFDFIFNLDNVNKMKPDKYDVTVYGSKTLHNGTLMAKFVGEKITYFVALSPESTFQE